MNAYRVTYQVSEAIFSTNIVIADCEETVMNHYGNEWLYLSNAAEWEIEEAKRKGMPIITLQ